MHHCPVHVSHSSPRPISQAARDSGRRESCRESSGRPAGQLRPPVPLSTQFHYSRSAWRKSARETGMCRYLEQLLYLPTVYLPDGPRICPSERASNQATGHSVYMSVHPSVAFNYNDLRSSAYLANKTRKFKCSAMLRPVTRRRVPQDLILRQHSTSTSNFTGRNTNQIDCLPITKHDVTRHYRHAECSMKHVVHRKSHKPTASCLFHDRVSTTQVRQSADKLLQAYECKKNWDISGRNGFSGFTL